MKNLKAQTPNFRENSSLKPLADATRRGLQFGVSMKFEGWNLKFQEAAPR